jgi:hypothetical protein
MLNDFVNVALHSIQANPKPSNSILEAYTSPPQIVPVALEPLDEFIGRFLFGMKLSTEQGHFVLQLSNAQSRTAAQFS